MTQEAEATVGLAFKAHAFIKRPCAWVFVDHIEAHPRTAARPCLAENCIQQASPEALTPGLSCDGDPVHQERALCQGAREPGKRRGAPQAWKTAVHPLQVGETGSDKLALSGLEACQTHHRTVGVYGREREVRVHGGAQKLQRLFLGPEPSAQLLGKGGPVDLCGLTGLIGRKSTAYLDLSHAPHVAVCGARASCRRQNAFRELSSLVIPARVWPAGGHAVANVVVVGAQWGDEGKGKIVDWLSERADVVARFQGGHNAGHTLVIEGEVYKLHALPSGVVRGGKLSVIGNGVVLDPWHLVEEIAGLQVQGVDISPESLMIAENTPLILPFHGELDRARESQNSVAKIGTTGRGIGPAYEDKVGRRVIRVADLADPETLAKRVDRALVHHDALRRGLGLEAIDRDGVLRQLQDIAPKILPYAAPVWKVMTEARRAGKRILFEGAQGALLDIDFGTYPFVTSSNVIAGQAATGVGLGPGAIDFVLGIVKAYTTRVGEGPFPTELDDADGQRLGERGHEFGTTTGRKRRCGWFDAVLVRQTCAVSGVSGISLTKLDVLDGFEKLRICTGYMLDGVEIDYLPTASEEQARVVPVYEEMDGWSESTAGARSWADLPAEAIKYVRRVEELINCPVALLSTSPERDDTILVTDPFAD